MRHQLFTILFCLLVVGLSAQVQKPSSDISWRKRISMADEFVEKNDYASAAVFYESVFTEKSSKLDIAYKAGEAYLNSRNYPEAAKLFKAVKDETKEYPKVQYYYAKALKQSGDYKAAIPVFESFINNYQSGDAAMMKTLVDNEIAGARYALKLRNSNRAADVKMEHLSRMVNSDKKEFAPIPFVENLMYFSSMSEGMGQIFRSERGGGGWDRPEKPSIFKSMEKPHFGHGSFTPDRKSFYFTQCDLDKSGELRCDIYVMPRVNNAWKKAVRLPDYVNEDGSTSTQPYVTVVNGKEILFFASDRKDGVGGMDIWYATRAEGASDFNYSVPVNLGPTINTIGDDVTPFYDKISEVLYFSSTGHPGVGGYDVFSSSGKIGNWNQPKNLGFPTNSGADDYYYILGGSREYGYLISNRLEGTKKEYTDNDDIFQFEKKEIEVVIKGSIYEEGNDSKLLDNVTVGLIEINETGSENVLETKRFNDGEYFFRLSPKKKYKIEAARDGYEAKYFEIETDNFSGNSDFTQDLALEKIEIVQAPPKPPIKPPVKPGQKPQSSSAVGDVDNYPPPTKPEVEPYVEEEVATTTQAPQKPQPSSYTENSSPGSSYYEEPETSIEVIEDPTVSPGYNTEVAIEEPEVEITYPSTDPPVQQEEYTSYTSSSTPKQRNFDDLSEMEIRGIFYVDGQPYFRSNGELIEVLGLVINEGSIIEGPKPTRIVPGETPIDVIVEDFGLLPNEETGINYKIQLVAVSEYKARKYSSVQNLGAIQTETTTSREGTTVQRVMLTPFQTLGEAKETLGRVNNLGFERAYIVKYVDGIRVKNSKIRLASFRG